MIALIDPAVIVPSIFFPVLTLCLNFLLQKLNYPIVILLLMPQTFLKHIVLYHIIASLLLASWNLGARHSVI